MKTKLRSLLLVAALGVTSSLSAQVTLESFSSFLSPSTLFFGDWSSTGDPFAGSVTPSAGLTQNASGFFNFSGVTNDASAFVERSFLSSLNLTGDSLITVTGRRLDTNSADSFTVFLVDNTGFNTASATFLTSSFGFGGFTSSTLTLTPDVPAFSFNAVSSFRISGNDPFASGNLGIALDSIVVSAPRVITAVPEPSTYGAIAAASLGLLAGVRGVRRRRTV